MDYRVILSKPAIRDLGVIARFIAEDNPSAAERIALQLLSIAESLRELPRRGNPIKARPGIRRLIEAPYVIAFRIDERAQIVYILRFWHARRNPEALLLE